jgi:TRAP-type mannitol/chloroaromatic compound transport system permease small subunit
VEEGSIPSLPGNLAEHVGGGKMKNFLKFIDSMSILVGKCVSFLMLIVVFMIGYEVVARYVFQSPTQWANEAMGMACALVYIMAGAWAIQADKHMKLELIYNKVSARGKAALDVATFGFFALYIVMLLWSASIFSWESILLLETSSSSWNPTVYPIKSALAIGTALVLIQGLAKFIRDIHFLVKGEKI